MATNFIDPLFDVDTAKLWRETLQPDIDFIISSYDDS
jgi:hypothetical protein